MMPDPLEHLLDGRSFGVFTKSRKEVLLQRLTGCCSSTSENSVHFLGYVLDLNARHTGQISAKMAPEQSKRSFTSRNGR